MKFSRDQIAQFDEIFKSKGYFAITKHGNAVSSLQHVLKGEEGIFGIGKVVTEPAIFYKKLGRLHIRLEFDTYRRSQIAEVEYSEIFSVGVMSDECMPAIEETIKKMRDVAPRIYLTWSFTQRMNHALERTPEFYLR